MNDLIPSEEIQEGLRGLLELLPLVYVIVIVISSIAFNILDFDGKLVKGYYWKIGLICIALAIIAYSFYPEEQVKVRDIPTLILGSITSIAIIKYLSYRWKKKKK